LQPQANPYRAFRRARVAHGLGQAGWIFFGHFAKGPRERDLPRPVEWLVDLPAMAESVLGMPMRLVELPWSNPANADRTAARHARSYLARRPGGAHAEALAAWLEEWESDRDNALGALPLAEARLAPGDEELAELRERAARQALDGAARERDAALRNGIYRQLARDLPRRRPRASRPARAARRGATPQHVHRRARREPELPGPRPIRLAIDAEAANGELHRRPRAARRARSVATSMPRATTSAGRDRSSGSAAMARIVRLEETSFRNSARETRCARPSVTRFRAPGLADEVDELGGPPELRLPRPATLGWCARGRSCLRPGAARLLRPLARRPCACAAARTPDAILYR
jgi:hypothetical protein